MAQLPVFEARAALLHQVSRAPTLVLVGATGSGKSTQIPQYLFHAGVSNHRRHAAAAGRGDVGRAPRRHGNGRGPG